jgi:hypothetical protein
MPTAREEADGAATVASCYGAPRPPSLRLSIMYNKKNGSPLYGCRFCFVDGYFI